MIIGIGVDAVDIARFAMWSTYSSKKLGTMFSAEELAYILTDTSAAPEHFAACFAVKEAAFKALSEFLKYSVKLRTFMRHCAIVHNADQKPFLQVEWDAVLRSDSQLLPTRLRTHVSLTHTDTLAIAYVIIEKNT